MQVTIEDRNRDGRGRGYGARKTALVSQAHPGEEVVVRVDRSTRGTVQGRVARLITRDPGRIDHACRQEFRCTGCPLLAAAEADERAFKRERVAGVLHELSLGDELIEWMGAPVGPFGYRHYAKRVFGVVKGRVVLGAYVAGTHLVADNAGCPILVPELTELLDDVAERTGAGSLSIHREGQRGLRYAVARQSSLDRRQLLVLVTSEPELDRIRPLAEALAEAHPALAGIAAIVNTSEGNVLLSGNVEVLTGDPRIEEGLLDHRFEVGPTSFFQVNPAAAELMIYRALEAAGKGRMCIEGYAGVGALTLPLSTRFDRVVAVEADAGALEDLQSNARRHGCAGIEGVVGDAAVLLPQLIEKWRPQVVVVDPPRRGLGEDLAGVLARSGVEALVMLACEPTSLGRDLPPLLGGGMALDRLLVVDQFPRTAHVEAVAVLRRV